ncbi:MAG: hypothetical protein ACRDGS_05625 [Chloroflexota bacterium]
MRLGTWMPFVPVTQGIAYFCKVTLSEPTARRKTEEAGQAYVEVQTAQVEEIARAADTGPVGPPVQQLSVDGAMVPLLHKEWGEVKTLALGVIGPPVQEKGEWHVHATQLSYFSRMTDHTTFSSLATVETHRRGTASAGTVCAVNDGAVWEQEFVDDHRPDAVRILDWGHSAEHLSAVGRAVFGPTPSTEQRWRTEQVRALKEDDPPPLLSELARLREALATGEEQGVGGEACAVVAANLEYFTKRQEQIHYARFAHAGYPIGSGTVESGNKLVVEARLKGAGMHWAPTHVDPMVALRTVACGDRWEDAWPRITARLRERTKERAACRRRARQEAKTAMESVPNLLPPRSETPMTRPAPSSILPVPTDPIATDRANPQPIPPSVGSRRPAANHPWRHQPIGKARYTDHRLLAS